jgi:iron complex outermembrane receptor protein
MKGFLRSEWVLFVLLATLFTVPGSAYSQAVPSQAAPERGQSYRMGEVVGTATRDTQEVRKVPANVTVITADDIQKSGATSVA